MSFEGSAAKYIQQLVIRLSSVKAETSCIAVARSMVQTPVEEGEYVHLL